LVGGPDCRLRLSSNLEIYYDGCVDSFWHVPAARDQVKRFIRCADVESGAALCRICGARSLAGWPSAALIYDYDQRDATAPFHTLSGAYTRYGPVLELLESFDDQYVLCRAGR